MKQTLAQVAASLGVDLIGEDRVFTQVSINTRTLAAGDLFIAIRGDNFDAHDYIAQAEQQGACALVVERCCDSVLPQIVVADTRTALGDIASLWSSAFSLPIVAITGSCGKTTVKEMCAAIFQKKYDDNNEAVLATQGNLNNEIGVPLTLLRLNKAHKVAVIELGANHQGEIKQLVSMVQPDVAVINNVTPAHVEGFGSLEGIAQAKAEIYTGLENEGIAVINADDAFSDYWMTFCQQQPSQNGTIKTLSFGLNDSADISAQYALTDSGLQLQIKTPDAEQAISLKLYGQHNVYNALAATAVTLSAGCSLSDIKQGLESFTHVAGRLEQKLGLHGVKIFDDSYNANPGSVKAGIDAITQLAAQTKSDTILILGDMGELGSESAQLHYQLGVDAAKMGITQLLTVGSISSNTTEGFNSAVNLTGNSATKKQAVSISPAMHFAEKNELIKTIKNNLHENSVLLIKGSRNMAMETVVTALQAHSSDKQQKTEGEQ